jgi:hypothetical protein
MPRPSSAKRLDHNVHWRKVRLVRVMQMITSGMEKAGFTLLAQAVFALDAAIQWFSIETAGSEPRFVWRDTEAHQLCDQTSRPHPEPADPLLLMLADSPQGSSSDIGSQNGRLRFVVLSYTKLVQVVARFGFSGYVNVAVHPRTDAYSLGRRLTALLENWA